MVNFIGKYKNYVGKLEQKVKQMHQERILLKEKVKSLSGQ